MPVTVQSDTDFPLTSKEVTLLWKHTREERQSPDDDITVRCVDEVEIQELNQKYRNKNYPTNVLTFSYEGEHDIALCLSVAEREAGERGEEVREYIALLLVHAFLHATHMDHEKSEEEADETELLEKNILEASGFLPLSL